MPEPLDDNQKSIIEKAVQQFIDAQFDGQTRNIDEFAKQYPGLEDQIRRRIQNLQEIDGLFANLMQAGENDLEGAAGADNLIGHRLGDFEILSLIGTGGMGAVFLARQLSLDRDVALKVISDISGVRGKSLERFKREAKVLAKISHANIVPIYEVGQDGPYSYFAMEYVKGTSLDRILSAIRSAAPGLKASRVMQECLQGRVSSSEDSREIPGGGEIDADYIITISRIIISIASALDYAHEKGVLHRDVKPSNILIDASGTPKLVDFGLARAETQQTITVTGEFFGTPSYVSPEQIRKPETVDCRSDVYSLGSAFYECLTLHPPFEGDTVNETLTRVIAREPIPPKKYCPRLSGDLNTVLLHAIEKSPEDRYGSAADFAADIENVLDFRPITAKRPSITRRAYKALRRRPIKIVLITIAVIVGVLSYWVVSDELESRTRKAAKELFDTARNKVTVKNYGEALTLFQGALTKDKSYVDAYLGAADCERVLGNYDEAMRLSREAISLETNNAMAYYQLGTAFVGQKDFGQAKSAYQRALSIDKNFSLARVGLAVCYGKLGLDNEAVEESRRLIAIDPDHPAKKQVLFIIASTLASLGKPQEAIEAYEEVLEIDPENANAYFGLGNCYGMLNDQTKSQEAFKRAASIEPENLQARTRLAQIHLINGQPSLAVGTYRSAGEDCQHSGKFGQAIQFYKSALEIDPNNVLVLIGAGECYQGLKNYREAAVAFKKAVWCASDDSNRAALACVKLGSCFREMGQDANATSAYLDAIKIDPNYYTGYFTLGAHYAAKGLYEMAIDVYTKAVSVDPTKSEVYRSLGSCYMSLAKYSEATEYYQRYLANDPNSDFVLTSMALCYQQLDNHLKAVELLERAVAIQPHEEHTYSSLGYSYSAIGKHFEALGAYNKALAINPNNAGSWGCLAECYEKLGIFDQAVKSYQKSLNLKADSYIGLTKLATLYATCSDAKLRDGDKAIKLATRACELTGYQYDFCMSGLAAAYAQCGDFEKAVEYQKKAIELSDSETKKEYEKRLATYEAKRPWRQ